ncbi:Bowman-Birk type trypsin inhibitor [Rhynchospora pubera]|uniref:Bowman-Birk type trypsin inhibitor n=1 Tax=Rhynchospora pubera TaxID=906938 RepID=A0AAV8HQD5_9POAL|nr:Bowman-Birk type trypsin inhibitor [Rhynchospora pubera]
MARVATSSLFICFVISCILIRHASSAENTMKEQAGTCCKTCNICTRSFPPLCRCEDLFTECPPKCTNCEKVEPQTDSTSASTPLYRCHTLLLDPCNRPCEKASSLNGQ